MAAVKVVLATAYPADPRQPRGGVEAVSVALAAALAREAGLEVHVVTADASCTSARDSTNDGVHVHRLPWRARRMLAGATGAEGRAVRAAVDALAPDVVHAHDTYGIMVADLPRPRVLTIHGFIHADTAVSGERFARLRALAWRRVETAAWAKFPRIISISPYVRERLTGFATGVIHDIDNPIDDRFFAVERRPQGRRVFTPASISPRKHTLGLLEAFAVLVARGVDATLRLAGPEPLPDYAAAARRRAAAPDLAGRVTFLPPLPTEGVAEELAAARVMALVSLEENAPMAVEEAMAAGVPVVTSNRCGMPYQVSDGESGCLVDPCDPDEVAGRLAEVLEDEGLAARLAGRARMVAEDRFRAATVARRTREVYARAVAAGGA